MGKMVRSFLVTTGFHFAKWVMINVLIFYLVSQFFLWYPNFFSDALTITLVPETICHKSEKNMRKLASVLKNWKKFEKNFRDIILWKFRTKLAKILCINRQNIWWKFLENYVKNWRKIRETFENFRDILWS